MVSELGELRKVALRDIWKTEDRHFTPWLAMASNIAKLGKEIGIDLEVEETEKYVGPFRADIVCKDTPGNWVLIENQLELTDHKHLGQLLTYATDIGAVTMIWIAKKFTEEHRATLDWLNNITDDQSNFFGIEVELWKIGTSPAAPHFKIVSKPNDWIKSKKVAARMTTSKNLTKTKLLQQKFWEGFHQHLSRNSDILSPRSPRPQHWMDLATGRAKTWHKLTMNTRDKLISSWIAIKTENRLELFNQLRDESEILESELGFELTWHELAEKKESYVGIDHHCNTKDESKWPEMYTWLTETAESMQKTFGPRLKR